MTMNPAPGRAIQRAGTIYMNPYKRYYFSKWVTFSCATLLMLSAGLQYAFSVYGEPLQRELQLPNGDLATLGAFSNAGGYSAILAGLFYD
jgi:Nodulin-like